MPCVPTWRRYLRFWHADVQADVDDELRFHFEAREAELRARGLAPDAITRTIAEEFGDVEATRRALREIGERVERRRERLRWWHELRADLGYALRGLRRQPTFAAAALLTLALGIGATAAMLSAARAALVGLMPFADADRLVAVWEAPPQDLAARAAASPPELLDWRSGTNAFAALEAYDETNVTLTGLGEPGRLQGARVTPGFLAMLGARPVLGSGFTSGDDAGSEVPTAIVSHDFWRRRLGGDSAALGHTLTLDGRVFTVVGVLPRDFRFVLAGEVEVWIPLDRVAGGSTDRADRRLRVVGRLRGGVSAERASFELATVMRRLATQYPESNTGRTARAIPLRDEIVGPVRPLLVALGGAVALLLLVACTNVASLFLTRAVARGRELAMRVALGAGRGRVVRQLLAESVLVAVLGAAAGVALAWGGVAWLASAASPQAVGRVPFLRGLTLDAAVLGSVALVTLACGLAFGVAPALHAARLSFGGLGRREAGTSGNRARRAFLVAQLAFTTVLLVGTGLMTRSVVALFRVDPGFATERVVTMRVALAGARYDDPVAQRRFVETLVAQVGALPGVRVVGAVSQVPLSGGGMGRLHVDGAAPEPTRAARPEAMRRLVAGDYFRAMGIRVVEGRALEARDDSTAPPALVMSEGLARRLFGPEPALGRRVRFDDAPGTAWTVVGLAADVRATSLDAAPTPIAYVSHLQAPENRMTLVARAAGDRAALLAAMRRAAGALDPSLPVYQVGTMAEQVAGTPAVYVRRYVLLLLSGFAVAATLLAAVGLYGVTADQVARRTRELGIRAALGATRRAVVALVVRQGSALAAAGIVIGLVSAAALARGLRAFLYGVEPADLLTYAAGTTLLAAVTLLATLLPARRAAHVNPADALRRD
jgi:predicted permease